MRKALYALMLVVVLLCIRSNYKVIESHSNSIKYLNTSIDNLVTADKIENTDIILSNAVLKANVVITNGAGHASGVAIQSNLIVTAGHVLNHSNLYVIDINDVKYKIIDTWRSDKYDIAFIIIDGELPAIQLGQMPKLLDTVYAIGSPYDISYATTITKGIISNLDRDVYGKIDLIQTDAEGAPGSSGGALLDNNLQVVGICVCGPVPGGGVVCYEPVTHIKECLEIYNEDR